ncbi:hypothetical protein, partial [Burkholderia glumae]
RDDLRGLKENVIVGRLIPAGTGLAFHKARRNKEVSDRERFDQIAQEEAFEFGIPETPAAADPTDAVESQQHPSAE